MLNLHNPVSPGYSGVQTQGPLEGLQHTLGGINRKFENTPLHSAYLQHIFFDTWRLSLRSALSQNGRVSDDASAATENLVNGTVWERDHEQVAVRSGLDIRAHLEVQAELPKETSVGSMTLTENAD